MNHIIDELKDDNISMNDVVIIADAGEILMRIKKVVQPSWPKIFHVQSFMGDEAPVVIWVTGSQYLDRQVRLFSKYNTYNIFFSWRQQVEP